MADGDRKALDSQNLSYVSPEPEPGSGSPSSSLNPLRPNGPPLTPRERTESDAPPPYSAMDQGQFLAMGQWRSRDPRSSSTQSLAPSESNRGGRRTLLLIYIHGFMGNEMSFQSFPAHVHSLLTNAMAETHVVHTKLYPRYKSRRAMEFARDDFSDWLEPHEGALIDVVLLGHSMGGLLAAEVALMPPKSPATGKPLRHRILGTISFDTPFLGIHPGLVSSGIASLFRTAPVSQEPAQAAPSGSSSQVSISNSNDPIHNAMSLNPASLSPTQSQASSIFSVPPKDPYYDPPFVNDIHRPERTGWNKLLYFVNKHSEDLTSLASATKQYFTSHLEFGGCLADFQGLRIRYAKIRALEDVDDISDRVSLGSQVPSTRVRFLNYYTASTGIPKKAKIPPGQTMDDDGNLKPLDEDMRDMSLSGSSINVQNAKSDGPATLVNDDTSDGSAIKSHMKHLDEASSVSREEDVNDDGDREDDDEPPAMRHIDSMPMEEDEPFVESQNSVKDDIQDQPPTDRQVKTTASEPALPPIPPIPEEPQFPDPSIYTDKDERKIAEKEQKRVTKAYQQAIKDRENAIKDREKLIEKREKKARQEEEKQLKADQKQRAKEKKREKEEEERRQATVNPPPVSEKSTAGEAEKPKKDRKFCLLPPTVNGQVDKCWVRVYMQGVDEVGAHCGLFFPGPQYAGLVSDVGARVAEWVSVDATRRAILEMDGA